MNSPEPDDEEDQRDSGRSRRALDRIEDTLEADVAEARAIAPLVADAASVPRMLRKRLKRWLPILGIGALAAIVIFSGAYKQLKVESLAENYAFLRGWVDAHPVLAGATLAGAIATIVSTGLPGGVVLVVAGGLFFGTVVGALLAAIGDAVGASVLYFAARRFFDDSGKPPAMVEKIRAGFQRNPASFAFFIRAIPVFPFGAMSVALAWLGCRYPLFLAASGLAVIPACLVVSALGAGLANTISERREIEISLLAEPRFAVPLIALAVLALIPALLGFRRKKPVEPPTKD